MTTAVCSLNILLVLHSDGAFKLSRTIFNFFFTLKYSYLSILYWYILCFLTFYNIFRDSRNYIKHSEYQNSERKKEFNIVYETRLVILTLLIVILCNFTPRNHTNEHFITELSTLHDAIRIRYRGKVLSIKY